jgi:hypothetical protein
MFASPLNDHKPGTSPVPYTLRRYLTMRVLATALFIAFAVLASIGGKETQTKQPLLDKSTVGDLTLRHQDQGGCADAPKKSSPTISWQSIATVMNNFKEAFNDPSIIDYANQQATGIPDLPTAPLLGSSNQDSFCSKSASIQSRKPSSSGY